MSLPDEEFDVLGVDELALLTKRFDRLHESRVNTKRATRTCLQCGKLGHFVADCPEKTKNKDGYKDGFKHRSSKDNKYISRRNHKHKNKHKDERWSRKKEGRGRKARAMVGASDVDPSSAYSSLSSTSSEDDGDRRKKSHQCDSDSDSEDEVRDELPFLREENECLGQLLDNCDDMLREAKNIRKKLRASLEDARKRVAELES
jgi:hypothetical protein